MQRIGIDRGEKIYYDEFELFLYQCFKEIDEEERFKRVYVILEDNSKRTRLVNVAGSKNGDKHHHSSSTGQKCSLI